MRRAARISRRTSINRLNRRSIKNATILMGNDDGAFIWLNGEKVFDNREHLAAIPERNKAAVKLKKGVNTVLLKIVNGGNPHGFYFSIASEQELKMAK